jgi:hypothetical protein
MISSYFFFKPSYIYLCFYLFNSNYYSFFFSVSPFCIATCYSSFPCNTFSSIFFNFFIKFSWFCLYVFCYFSFSSISLINWFFSSSKIFFFLYISSFYFSNFFFIASCSAISFYSNYSTSSSSIILSIVPPAPTLTPKFLATCSLSLFISYWKERSTASNGSSFIRTSFFMFFARLAYFRVDRVSS